MTPPPRDAMLGGRVPLDLRDEVLDACKRLGIDKSTAVRLALREWVDRRRLPAPGEHLFEPRSGHARRGGAPTSRNAATVCRPRIGSQRRTALELIAAAGDTGLTTDEVVAELEAVARRTGTTAPAVNGIARRVSDLVQADAVVAGAVTFEDTATGLGNTVRGPRVNRPLRTGEAHIDGILVRRTRHDTPATVYLVTDLGRAWLAPEPTP